MYLKVKLKCSIKIAILKHHHIDILIYEMGFKIKCSRTHKSIQLYAQFVTKTKCFQTE